MYDEDETCTQCRNAVQDVLAAGIPCAAVTLSHSNYEVTPVSGAFEDTVEVRCDQGYSFHPLTEDWITFNSSCNVTGLWTPIDHCNRKQSSGQLPTVACLPGLQPVVPFCLSLCRKGLPGLTGRQQWQWYSQRRVFWICCWDCLFGGVWNARQTVIVLRQLSSRQNLELDFMST